jgi:hypothetical protein
MTKPVMEQDYTTSVVPSIQGKGLHELIRKKKFENKRKSQKKKLGYNFI